MTKQTAHLRLQYGLSYTIAPLVYAIIAHDSYIKAILYGYILSPQSNRKARKCCWWGDSHLSLFIQIIVLQKGNADVLALYFNEDPFRYPFEQGSVLQK